MDEDKVENELVICPNPNPVLDAIVMCSISMVQTVDTHVVCMWFRSNVGGLGINQHVGRRLPVRATALRCLSRLVCLELEC